MADEQAQDPVEQLVSGMQAFLEGIQETQVPDEVKGEAQNLLAHMQQFMGMLTGGGAPGGEQPVANQGEMAGGRPGAQMVR